MFCVKHFIAFQFKFDLDHFAMKLYHLILKKSMEYPFLMLIGGKKIIKKEFLPMLNLMKMVNSSKAKRQCWTS